MFDGGCIGPERVDCEDGLGLLRRVPKAQRGSQNKPLD